jgi:3-dehydrosphinganine reductase
MDIFLKGPAPETRRVICLSVDVANPTQVQEAVNKVLAENQELDVLINCAGFSIPKVLEQLSDEELRRMVEVNYLGSAYVTRALLPALKRRYPAGGARSSPMRNGHVVFVGSMAGQFPVYGYGSYAASKFAVRGFAEGLQMELAAHPLLVTLAHPADTNTPGYAVENQLKSELTMKLSNEGGVFSPEETAHKILEDTLRGKFLSWIGMNGYLLARITAGMAPARSLLDTFIEIVAAPLLRIVAFFVVSDFYSKVRRWAPATAQPAAASNSGGKKRD